ncbi:DUF7674 family protein [Brevibacillus dissolubilis]|uniref:DUF7674 family protein n=1 Tax=Brevibacillus dissolubilis TaxID=1844116 RepID=UPI001115F1FE|nr:hypothetical protein [Brevibacillus dissolubilis]
MSRVLEYGKLISNLLSHLPAIRPYYEEEMEWLKEDLPHVIFGIVVVPYIVKHLQEQEGLEEIFEFLEKMAVSNDEEVEGVLVVSVLEPLLIERDVIGLAESQMRQKTRQLFDIIKKTNGFH